MGVPSDVIAALLGAYAAFAALPAVADPHRLRGESAGRHNGRASTKMQRRPSSEGIHPACLRANQHMNAQVTRKLETRNRNNATQMPVNKLPRDA